MQKHIKKDAGFNNLLWELKIIEIEKLVQETTDMHRLHQEGFNNLRKGLEEFLDLNNEVYDQEYAYLKIYSNAYVESTDIIRATDSFHSQEWFSDVTVSSEEGEWHGKVYRYGESILIVIY